MLNTPVKGQKSALVSDFANTHNELKTGMKEKKCCDSNFDELSTPKRYEIYIPIKDRLLRKNEFRQIKNNRVKLLDWYLEIFSTYQLGW